MRAASLLLSLLFGGDQAVALLKAAATDPSAAADWRRSALEALVERRVPGLAPWLQQLLDDPALRGPALRALAAYDDPETPQAILRRYAALTEAERDDAVTTLASRPASALALLDAVAAGTVPRRDLSATTARQLQAFGDRRHRRAARGGLGRAPAHLRREGRADGQVQGAADAGARARRPTRRAGGSSSTGPASSATGSTTPAATSGPT